ncbi:MAG: hypothetical protein P1V13_22300 [Rhizobiaceae bacterium]|nr:hypothetical protein [Rhizobiaceae bacterium]
MSGDIDVLGVARSIVENPRRGVINASTLQLTALAQFTLDLWEVASSAEAMATGLQPIGQPDIHERVRLRVIGAAIIEEMKRIAGPAPASSEGETS